MRRHRFLKAFQVLLVCVVLLVLLLPGASAEETTLRVAFYPLDGFFEYDAQGHEIGYGVDLLDKITQYTGIHFTYVRAKSWEDTKPMLLDGEADVRMPGTISATPSTTLGYTQHGIIDTYYAALALKSRTDLVYEDFETFAHLRYAVSKTLYSETPVKDHLGDILITEDNLVFYDGYNDCKAALDAGEVDAVITNIMDMDDSMKPLARFTTRSNYISMTINNPYLDTLNDALSRIKLEEPNFLADLYSKWFPERVAVPLTKQESNYLDTLDSLAFSFRDGQGYLSHLESDGTFVGFYPTVARLACEKLGLAYEQTELTEVPDNGIVIVPDFYYDYTWAQENDTNITPAYMTVNYYELARKGEHTNEADLRVAAVKDFRVTQDYIRNGYTEKQMVWCKDYEDCIEAVYSGQADVTYINSYAAEYYLSLYRYSNLSTTLTDYSHQVCFGVWGDESGLLASSLGKILGTISDEELSTMMVEATTLKPKQDLLTEWIYQNPARSTVAIGILSAMFVLTVSLALFVRRARMQNLALRKATSAKQDFLSRMSHDMRTPMNAIIGFSSFGEESTDITQAREYHHKIHQAGQYLLRLINDTLDLNKMETGMFELHLEPYSNTEFIETISNILLPRAQEKGVDFRVENALSNPETLLFDKIRLQQIFVNLINNAIEFTPSGGHVTFLINATPEEDGRATAIFTVRDDGIGMTTEFQKEKMYKPFVQEHRSDSTESGTGLGLSIVKELVVAMHGTIACASVPGEGTTFTVGLPSVVTKPDEKTVEKPKNRLELTGRRILLCEDQRLNREIAVRLLQKVGAQVTTAEDGRRGLDIFTASSVGYFDAVLMDIRMPQMDGLATTKAIRALSRADAKQVPIIAMTANAYEEDVQKSLDAGMNAHLAKPIDPQLLYDTLQEQIWTRAVNKV